MPAWNDTTSISAPPRHSQHLKVPLTDNKSVGTLSHKLRGKGASDPDCLHSALMQQELDLLRGSAACHGYFQGTDRGISSLLLYSNSSPAITWAKDEHNHWQCLQQGTGPASHGNHLSYITIWSSGLFKKPTSQILRYEKLKYHRKIWMKRSCWDEKGSCSLAH